MSSVLITGATGTFGRACLRRVLKENLWERPIAFSRDEVKQAALYQEFGGEDGPRLFLGDVRDKERLSIAMRGVDDVIHAAALKRVDAGAYSPSEMTATNVYGTMNVVNAAIEAGVKRVVVISSDKAVAPVNIYGATKYLAECYAVNANAYGYKTGTKISCVRYGNIAGSRGSVVPLWRHQVKARVPMTLTDPRMCRFIMTIEQAVDLVLFALKHMRGGEIFIPLLPSATIEDLAKAVAYASAELQDYPITWAGARPGGEKFAESLLNEEEPTRTWVLGKHYVIAPSHHRWTSETSWGDSKVDPRMTYRSDGPTQTWLGPKELFTILMQTETWE